MSGATSVKVRVGPPTTILGGPAHRDGTASVSCHPGEKATGGGGSVVRWYELLPAKAEARQVGTISDPNLYVFNAAIAPTLLGGAVINYNTGSASELVEIMAQSRVPTAPLNQMSGPIVLGSSSARDADFSCPSVDPFAESCRWGDYAGASVDPTNGNVVWGSSQVNGPITPENDAQWATRNFALEADDVAPIASFTVSANPSPGVPVEFNASTSNDPDGTIESYKWKFGDGGEASGQTGGDLSMRYELNQNEPTNSAPISKPSSRKARSLAPRPIACHDRSNRKYEAGNGSNAKHLQNSSSVGFVASARLLISSRQSGPA